jgi:hypothetical protein
MTMTEDGQEIEDLLAGLAKSGPSEPERAAILADVDHRLSNRDIPYDEWEILFRERLQVERDLLTGTRPGTASPANPNGGGRRFSVGRVATGAAVAVGLALTVLNGAMVVVEARESARENKREARRR